MDQFTELLEFLKVYGAPVVFLWAILETDLVFLVVGALAHSKGLNPFSCFPAAVLGALVHDSIVFWLARNRADWVRARKAYQNLAPSLERFARVAGPWQLALCRPLYGTRYPTIIYWGLQNLSYSRFLTCINAGLITWAALLATTGYKLFHYINDFDDWLSEAKNWIFGAVIVAILLYLAKKKLTHKPAQAAPESTPVNTKTSTGEIS